MKSLPRLSVENPILVNLFMVSIFAAGIWSGLTMIRELFPESRPDKVLVVTTYPGATPSEVEKGITLKIEERVKDVEGVEKITASITEGISSVFIEMESGYDDIDQAVTDVKAAIDTIPQEDFPDESKESRTSKFDPKLPVISVAVFGDVDDRGLKTLAEDLKDDLLKLPDVTNVVISGTRRDEISVEVRPEKLAEYNLSFLQVAEAIRVSNLDLPAGQVRTPNSNVAVRTLGEEDRGEDLLDIVLRSDPSGRVLRVRDVATIIDGFEDIDLLGRFNGKPAVTATVYKTPDQDAIKIASAVRAMVAGKKGRPLERSFADRLVAALSREDVVGRVYEEALNDPFPPNIETETYSDLSRFIEGRLELLERNGFWGLILVALSLLVFLHWRVAFWVMMGLVLAIMGSLVAMHFLGQTLNLMTMFGLIIVLGLLVDDAIIVSEHVYTKVEQGLAPREAATTGAEEVTWPVVCAIATTIVAFLPLMFIDGQIGDWMGVLPVIVCVALTVSLFEALAILPSHLAHGLRPIRQRVRQDEASKGKPSLLTRVRATQANFVNNTLKTRYEGVLRTAVRFRYVTISILAGLFIAVLGAVIGGHVPFVFLQKLDGETIVVATTMEIGTPIDETVAAAKVVEAAALELPETRQVYTIAGLQLSDDGTKAGQSSHLAQLFIEIQPAEKRNRTSDDMIQAMRKKTDDIPGVRKMKYQTIQGGPAGAPIHLEIAGDDIDQLVAASKVVKEELETFEGVFDVLDDFDAGRREVQIELFDSARALGLTTELLALQVRSAFYGFEAEKVQRGDEDVKIMVRYPAEYRSRVYDVEEMRIATPGGTLVPFQPSDTLVPFKEVARLTEGTGFASINRKDQQRAVTITADVNETVTKSDLVIAKLEGLFPDLRERFPGIELEWGGQKLETKKSFASLETDFLAALAMIYVILAGLFRSYVQPLIVMSVIPFGLIGAVGGHFVMGYPLTILSMIGLVALTGIVVNDSMILVSFVNKRREEGMDAFEAVIDGGKSRLRAILLTSATTVLGIAPLLLETSFQARFLIPMGISISAGLLFATVLTLIAIPSLYMVVEDVKMIAAWVIGTPPRQAQPT